MEDKRTRYTKMFLRESLIKKLGEKPISRITITELCKDAEVNRSTYYAHYADQYDQLAQIEREFMADIVKEFSPAHIGGEGADFQTITEKIILYISENAELCRVLLGSNGSADFQKSFSDFLRSTVLTLWHGRVTLDTRETEYVYTFVLGGCIGIMRKWLFDRDETKTPHEMAALIVSLANQGISVFIKP
jgi:AcrR family transcriptional regulator